MSLMQCRTRTALELSRTRRSADDRYYYEMPEFDSVHAECISKAYDITALARLKMTYDSVVSCDKRHYLCQSLVGMACRVYSPALQWVVSTELWCLLCRSSQTSPGNETASTPVVQTASPSPSPIFTIFSRNSLNRFVIVGTACTTFSHLQFSLILSNCICGYTCISISCIFIFYFRVTILAL